MDDEARLSREKKRSLDIYPSGSGTTDYVILFSQGTSGGADCTRATHDVIGRAMHQPQLGVNDALYWLVQL